MEEQTRPFVCHFLQDLWKLSYDAGDSLVVEVEHEFGEVTAEE